MATYGESRPAMSNVGNGLENTYGTRSPEGRVGFTQQSREDVHEKKKKYLTAKYGLHQMKLIRKRLNVEDWMDSQLRDLYNCQDDVDTYDCEIDLDDVLDLEKDDERRKHVQDLLQNVKRTDLVNKFLDDLLEKVKTL